jgi:hypothetical protein
MFFPLRLFSIRGLSLASLILFEVFRLFLFCWWLFFHRTLHETLKSSRGLDQGEAGLGVLDLAQMHRTLGHDHFEGRPHARFAEMSSFRAAIAGADHNVYIQRGRAIRAFFSCDRPGTSRWYTTPATTMMAKATTMAMK